MVTATVAQAAVRARQPLELGRAWVMALRLDEVIAALPHGAPGPASRSTAAQRLDAWKHFIGIDPEQAVASWSEALGVARSRVISAIALDRRAADFGQPPAWGRTIARVLGQLQQGAGPGSADLEDPASSAIWPWVGEARAQLTASLGASWRRRSPSGFAVAEAPAILLPAFAATCRLWAWRAAVLELNASRLRGQLPGQDSGERYRSFCARLDSGPSAAEFWLEYIVLSRLLAEEVARWVAAQVGLLRRLDADWVRLLRCGLVRESALLRSVEPLGDRHDGGEAVQVLDFSDGQKLVYKPRPVRAEASFARVVERVTTEALGAVPPGPGQLDRGGYGWAAYVTAKDEAGAEEIGLYFRRAGVALAVAYALGVTDLISDNVIADGTVPRFIDAEAVLTPPWPGGGPRLSTDVSPFATGMIPGVLIDGDADFGGLAENRGNAAWAQRVCRLASAGTDLAHAAAERYVATTPKNLPDNCERRSPAQRAADISDGFSAGRLVISSHGDLIPDGLGSDLGAHRARFIARDSSAYARVLLASFHPNLLRDAYDREALFARLAHRVNWTRKLFGEERMALWGGDIPRFWHSPGRKDLWSSRGRRFAGVFPQSGLARSRERVARFGPCSEARCLWHLRAGFGSPRPAGSLGFAPTGDARADCLDLANRIGARIADLGYEERGLATWWDYAEDTASVPGTPRLIPMGLDMYYGLSGLLLFFALLAAVGGEPRWTRVSCAIFERIRRMQQENKGASLPLHASSGLSGAFTGSASLVFALPHAAAVVGARRASRALDMAIQALGRVVEVEEASDFVTGLAGAACALLVADAKFPGCSAAGLAVACGEKLLARAQRGAFGATWATVEGRTLPGLGHGVAGITLALHRLAERTGRVDFRRGAACGVRYLESAYRADRKCWPDPRGPDGGLDFGWCAGAAGVGYAHLALGRVVGARAAISNAFSAVVRSAVPEVDGICHGEFGGLSFLFSAARCLGGPERMSTAEERLRAALGRIAREGFRFRCVETLGLMLGLAGCGIELLRIATRGAVPTPLILEPVRGTNGRDRPSTKGALT